MLANYHTHTKRCGHAFGKMEEYILEAIKCGYKILGFSDHCPFVGKDQPGIRMSYELLDDYIEEFNRLKNKYEDQIELHIGLEVEYYDEYLDYYRFLTEEKGIEYLICGQHCNMTETGFEWYDNNPEICAKRVELMIKAMKSGLFLYVAHPDIFVKETIVEIPLFEQLTNQLIEASIKYNCPLEINEQGLLNQIESEYKPLYPYMPFWELVGKSNAKVIIGVDAHHIKSFTHPALQECYSIAKQCKVNLIEDVKIK